MNPPARGLALGILALGFATTAAAGSAIGTTLAAAPGDTPVIQQIHMMAMHAICDEVEQALKTLGANIRTARLRRNLTIGEMAEKIGTGERAVADAEHLGADLLHQRHHFAL